jgi:hypothetical protein
MKSFLALAVTLFISFHSIAQITFNDHAIELKLNVKDLDKMKDIKATSTCGDVKITIDEKLFSGGCAGVLVREYTAVDDCGNKLSTSQFIHLTDDEAPEFVVKSTSASSDSYITVSDLSEIKEPEVRDYHPNKPVITYSDQPNDTGIKRTWVATDLCGNSSTRTDIIKVLKVN